MFSRFFIDRPIFASVLSNVITLAGGVTLWTLPVAQYPDITPPTVEVSAYYPGANAQVVAKHLESHVAVTWVQHAGLSSSPYHALAKKYLPKGAGAVFTFGIKGGYQAGKKFMDALQLFSHLANVGDAKSLVIHPSSSTHQQLTEADQAAAGVTPDMIRLSVGLEDLDDILWDLDQALAKSQS